MWAARRLLLGRHHAAVVSPLRPRHPLAIPRRRDISSGEDPSATKRHLYLVLDDHKNGFGIHKLDLDDGDLDGGLGLPEPLLPRISLPAGGGDEEYDFTTQFTALGSCIVATGINVHGWLEENNDGAALIYDTKTAALAVSPHLPRGLCLGRYDAAVAVGNRLYFFESKSEVNYKLIDRHKMRDGGLHCLVADCDDGDEMPWEWDGWRPLPSYSRRWFWNRAKMPVKFDADEITAYLVHPPDRTIVLSLSNGRYCYRDKSWTTTFSYDTSCNSWTPCGDWMLPFTGRAHYDGKLDAWVGINDDGYLSVCDAMSASMLVAQRPESKVGREKLFLEDRKWRHIDSKLVHMGERNEYCLLERLRPNAQDEKECLGDGDKCLLLLTNFSVQCGEDGVPLTTAHRPPRTYRVSRYHINFDAQAFWM